MTRTELEVRLFALIRDTFMEPNLSLSDSTTAEDVDGWDSLSHTVLMTRIERDLGVRLPVEETLDIENVGQLVDLVYHIVTRPAPSA